MLATIKRAAVELAGRNKKLGDAYRKLVFAAAANPRKSVSLAEIEAASGLTGEAALGQFSSDVEDARVFADATRASETADSRISGIKLATLNENIEVAEAAFREAERRKTAYLGDCRRAGEAANEVGRIATSNERLWPQTYEQPEPVGEARPEFDFENDNEAAWSSADN